MADKIQPSVYHRNGGSFLANHTIGVRGSGHLHRRSKARPPHRPWLRHRSATRSAVMRRRRKRHGPSPLAEAERTELDRSSSSPKRETSSRPPTVWRTEDHHAHPERVRRGPGQQGTALRNLRIRLHSTTHRANHWWCSRQPVRQRHRIQHRRRCDVPVRPPCRRASRPAPLQGPNGERPELSAISGRGCAGRVTGPRCERCRFRCRFGFRTWSHLSHLIARIAPESYASTLITTRRFCARPSRVLFGATGLSSP